MPLHVSCLHVRMVLRRAALGPRAREGAGGDCRRAAQGERMAGGAAVRGPHGAPQGAERQQRAAHRVLSRGAMAAARPGAAAGRARGHALRGCFTWLYLAVGGLRDANASVFAWFRRRNHGHGAGMWGNGSPCCCQASLRLGSFPHLGLAKLLNASNWQVFMKSGREIGLSVSFHIIQGSIHLLLSQGNYKLKLGFWGAIPSSLEETNEF